MIIPIFLPEEIKYKIWKIYFSTYVLNRISWYSTICSDCGITEYYGKNIQQLDHDLIPKKHPKCGNHEKYGTPKPYNNNDWNNTIWYTSIYGCTVKNKYDEYYEYCMCTEDIIPVKSIVCYDCRIRKNWTCIICPRCRYTKYEGEDVYKFMCNNSDYHSDMICNGDNYISQDESDDDEIQVYLCTCSGEKVPIVYNICNPHCEILK